MWVVMLSPFPYKLPMVVIMMLPLHTLQYHRLVWFHNRKYSSFNPQPELATVWQQRSTAADYICCSGYWVCVGIQPCSPWRDAAFGRSSIITQTILAFSIGPLLAHFYLIRSSGGCAEIRRLSCVDVNGPVDVTEAATA